MWDLAINFLGYVFAFWCIWKTLDFAFHGFHRKEHACTLCKHRSKEIKKLIEENHGLLERLGRVKEQELHVGDYRLLQQLNMATQKSLEGIYGIGPKRAKQVIESRPFFTMQEARAILPEWVVEDARRNTRWTLKR